MKTIKISIIGSGGVATNIGRLFHSKGMTITQILGRSAGSTQALAEKLQCSYSLDPQQLSQDADLYIMAVQDREIGSLITRIPIPAGSLVVHTAGGVSMDIFKGRFSHYGVLYPLQSLRKETVVIPEIPFYLDGNTADARLLLEALCIRAAATYRWADDRQRMRLHVAAVFCSNFPNYFYALTEQFCQVHQLDFSSMLPLIAETGHRMEREGISPSKLQTGPAIRKDIPTVEKHLHLLETDPEASSVYRYMTEQIANSHLFGAESPET